jgi:hypothetical protein
MHVSRNASSFKFQTRKAISYFLPFEVEFLRAHRKRPFPSVSPPPSPPQKALPTANPVTTSAISAGDYERIRQDFTSKQNALAPIKPSPPLGS